MGHTTLRKTTISARSRRKASKPRWIDYRQLIQMTNSNYTDLFKKLICEFAHKGVSVFRVAVNEVDESTTLRVLRASINSIDNRRKCHGAVPLAASTQTLIIRIRNLHSLTHTSSRLRVKPLSSARRSGSTDTAADEEDRVFWSCALEEMFSCDSNIAIRR